MYAHVTTIIVRSQNSSTSSQRNRVVSLCTYPFLSLITTGDLKLLRSQKLSLQNKRHSDFPGNSKGFSNTVRNLGQRQIFKQNMLLVFLSFKKFQMFFKFFFQEPRAENMYFSIIFQHLLTEWKSFLQKATQSIAMIQFTICFTQETYSLKSDTVGLINFSFVTWLKLFIFIVPLSVYEYKVEVALLITFFLCYLGLFTLNIKHMQ